MRASAPSASPSATRSSTKRREADARFGETGDVTTELDDADNPDSDDDGLPKLPPRRQRITAFVVFGIACLAVVAQLVVAALID